MKYTVLLFYFFDFVFSAHVNVHRNKKNSSLLNCPEYYKENFNLIKTNFKTFINRFYGGDKFTYKLEIFDLIHEQLNILLNSKNQMEYRLVYIGYKRSNDLYEVDIIQRVLNYISYCDSETSDSKFIDLDFLADNRQQIIYKTVNINFLADLQDLKNNFTSLDHELEGFYHTFLLFEKQNDFGRQNKFVFPRDARKNKSDENVFFGYTKIIENPLLAAKDDFNTSLRSSDESKPSDSDVSLPHVLMKKSIDLYENYSSKNENRDKREFEGFFFYFTLEEYSDKILLDVKMTHLTMDHDFTTDSLFGIPELKSGSTPSSGVPVPKAFVFPDVNLMADRLQTSGTSKMTFSAGIKSSEYNNKITLVKHDYNGEFFEITDQNFLFDYDTDFKRFKSHDIDKEIFFFYGLKAEKPNDINLDTSGNTFSKENSIELKYMNKTFKQRLDMTWTIFYKYMKGIKSNKDVLTRKDTYFHKNEDGSEQFLKEIIWEVDINSKDLFRKDYDGDKIVTKRKFTCESNNKMIQNFNSCSSKFFQINNSVCIRNLYPFDLFYNSELVFIDGPSKTFQKNYNGTMDHLFLKIKNEWRGAKFTILSHDIITDVYYDKVYLINNNKIAKFAVDKKSTSIKNVFWEEYLSNVYEIEEYNITNKRFKWHPSYIIKQEIDDELKKREDIYCAMRIYNNLQEFKKDILDKCNFYESALGNIQDCVRNSCRKDKDIITVANMLISMISFDKLAVNIDLYECYIFNGTIVARLMLEIEKRIEHCKQSHTSVAGSYLFIDVISDEKKLKKVLLCCEESLYNYNEFLVRYMISILRNRKHIKSQVLRKCYAIKANKEHVKDLENACKEFQTALLDKYPFSLTVFSDNYTKSENYQMFYDHMNRYIS